MKHSVAVLSVLVTSLAALSAQADTVLGVCQAPDGTQAVISASDSGVKVDLSNHGDELRDQWGNRSIRLSSAVTIGEADGVLKGCVELNATKLDPSEKAKHPLWTMFVCGSSDHPSIERGLYDATQFQPTDYLLDCPKGLMKALRAQN